MAMSTRPPRTSRATEWTTTAARIASDANETALNHDSGPALEHVVAELADVPRQTQDGREQREPIAPVGRGAASTHQRQQHRAERGTGDEPDEVQQFRRVVRAHRGIVP
jgi:hypothetical protein